ncbi:MAG: hypothetical protein IJ228_05540 [Succinivibrio sp.]|nr:hypothetical protein [Succinivibrio sp.]
MNKEVLDAIVAYIEEFNHTLDTPLDLSAGADSALYGPESELDSVTFVSLILDIEQLINDQFGKTVLLTDASAMSQQKSPFRTVGSLAGYITAQLDDIAHE